MADIELVIKLPKDIIEGAKSSPNYYPTYLFEKIWRAIANGTPLPKGHGQLIDADKLSEEIFVIDAYSEESVKEQINDAPTVIPADKE